MKLVDAKIVNHEKSSGDYNVLTLEAPTVASNVKPGQFIHLKVPGLEDRVLRRPFSIYKADESTLTILYKKVGKGTAAMQMMRSGSMVNVMGPLGNGFPQKQSETFPVLVAGGYGVAPLFLLAERMDEKGVIFLGAASSEDVLCVDDFQGLGWQIDISTDDGSEGAKGLVTTALELWLKSNGKEKECEFYACGPDGMLMSISETAIERGETAWLSMDKHMGCGVGACLACVQRLKDDEGSQRWGCVCQDGPVFESRTIIWNS